MDAGWLYDNYLLSKADEYAKKIYDEDYKANEDTVYFEEEECDEKSCTVSMRGEDNTF